MVYPAGFVEMIPTTTGPQRVRKMFAIAYVIVNVATGVLFPAFSRRAAKLKATIGVLGIASKLPARREGAWIYRNMEIYSHL